MSLTTAVLVAGLASEKVQLGLCGCHWLVAALEPDDVGGPQLNWLSLFPEWNILSHSGLAGPGSDRALRKIESMCCSAFLTVTRPRSPPYESERFGFSSST